MKKKLIKPLTEIKVKILIFYSDNEKQQKLEVM